MAERHLYPSGGRHGLVAHQLGRRIVSGAIPEGTLLPKEQDLATHYGVSRQAVREALKVLAAKGLVSSRRRTGTQVLPRSSWNLFDPDVLAWHPVDQLRPKFLGDLLEFRRMIEPEAAMLAAAKRDATGLTAMKTALNKMRETIKDNNAFNLADREFHEAIFAASGNDLIERLGKMLRPLLDAVAPVASSTFDSHVADMELHTALFETIEHCDPQKARVAMERIMQQSASDRQRDLREGNGKPSSP